MTEDKFEVNGINHLNPLAGYPVSQETELEARPVQESPRKESKEEAEISRIKEAVTEKKRRFPPLLPTSEILKEEKANQINKWNENPQIRNQGVQVIDTAKKKAVGKTFYWILAFLATLGLLAMGVGVLAGGYVALTGGFNSTINNICQQNVTIPTCPSIPAAPACPACNPIMNNTLNVNGFAEICKGYCINKGCNSSLF